MRDQEGVLTFPRKPVSGGKWETHPPVTEPSIQGICPIRPFTESV